MPLAKKPQMCIVSAPYIVAFRFWLRCIWRRRFWRRWYRWGCGRGRGCGCQKIDDAGSTSCSSCSQGRCCFASCFHCCLPLGFPTVFLAKLLWIPGSAGAAHDLAYQVFCVLAAKKMPHKRSQGARRRLPSFARMDTFSPWCMGSAELSADNCFPYTIRGVARRCNVLAAKSACRSVRAAIIRLAYFLHNFLAYFLAYFLCIFRMLRAELCSNQLLAALL